MKQIDKVVNLLNAAYAQDPAAMMCLLKNRVPCNKRLTKSGMLGVAEYKRAKFVEMKSRPGWTRERQLPAVDVVGAMGLLHGVLKALGINDAVAYSETPDGEFVGFAVLQKGKSVTKKPVRKE